MTGNFKANNPGNTFLLLIYGLLLKLPMFLHPVKPVVQHTDGFLFANLINWINSVASGIPVIYPVISFFLLYTQAVTFNQLVSMQRLMPKPNYLTGMSYLLITSLFTEWNILSAPLIISTLIIWVWANMSALNNHKNPKGTLFNIGMVIGVCTFLYFPSIAFALLIILGLLIIRPFQLQEWIIALLGIIAPYYFLMSYLFLTNKFNTYKLPGVALSLPKFYDNNWALAAIIIVLITTIVGLYFIRENYFRQLVQTRNSWALLFLYCIVALFIPFINAKQSFTYWVMCAIPLSAFLGAAFFYPKKDVMPKILHWLMVAFVIAFSYFVK